MQSFRRLSFGLALLVVFSGCASAQESAHERDFAIVTVFSVPGGEVEGVNYFFGDYVVETAEGEADAVFNLANMSWRGLADFDEGIIITLDEAEQWAAASLAISDSSALANESEEVAEFVRALVYPEFDIVETGDTLVFENAVFRYEISEALPLTPDQAQRFYAHDRLNAYRKAMMMRQFPPFAQLLITEALEARQILPTSMSLTVRMPQGTTRMDLSVRLEEVEPGEAASYRALIPQ